MKSKSRGSKNMLSAAQKTALSHFYVLGEMNYERARHIGISMRTLLALRRKEMIAASLNKYHVVSTSTMWAITDLGRRTERGDA